MPGSVTYDFALEVARGTVDGHSDIHKFGENPDIDTAAEDIWDAGGDYTFTTAGGADYFISSSDNSDTQEVELSILTEDSAGKWNREVFNMTLVGQTQTQIITPSGDKPIRIYRAENDGATDFAGDVYIYESDTVVAGVPQTATKIRAKIIIGNNQTLMAVYSVASDETAYIMSWNGDMSKKQTAVSRVELLVRSFGGAFKVKEPISLNTAATSYILREYKALTQITEKSDIKLRADADANNIAVSGGFDLRTIQNGT